MTRKDYIKIANALAEVRAVDFGVYKSPARCALNMMEQKLTKIFQDDNPRFDAERFTAAANLELY